MSVINTNYLSLVAQNNLQKSQSALGTAIERLSSGLRINSAKDDAAGQAIANRMGAQINGLNQAARNANDGISAAQTAEGALNQINDNLQRIRVLTVQAENGTNSDDDLTSIQNEIGQRLEEVNRISRETEFNGIRVLADGENLSIQVGANDGQKITIGMEKINANTLQLEGFNVNGAGEKANATATKDALTLAGAVAGTADNEYVVKTDNNNAKVADVLNRVATEGSSITVGAATFTVNADGKFEQSQTYTNGTGAAQISAAMTPAAAGQTVTAEVTIGGQSTDITIASDGKITSTASGNALYLDSTGNLTENGAGSPPAATISNLSASLAANAGSKIEFSDGKSFTTAAAAAGSEILVSDGAGTYTANAAGALATQLNAAAQGAVAGQVAQISLTYDGATTTLYVGNGGELFTDAGATTKFSLDGGATDATTNDLDAMVVSGDASVTIVAAGGTGDATNVGNTYSVNTNVALSGKEVTTAQINDALKAAPDADYTLTINMEDAQGGTATQQVDFTVAAGVVTATEFGAFALGTSTTLTALGASGEAVKISASSNELTDADTTDVSYFVQDEEGEIVTNNRGERVYQDADGDFTTSATTPSDRTPDALGVLDAAIAKVDAFRSDLGAIQNRFESAIQNLTTTSTNLAAAQSRIQDADYSVEVANMTRAQILQQAGTSVLAQANQIPQGVLSLLR